MTSHIIFSQILPLKTTRCVRVVKLKCTNATFPASPPEGPGCCCCLQANPLGIYCSARTLNIHVSRWSLISGLLCFSLHTHTMHTPRLHNGGFSRLPATYWQTACLPALHPANTQRETVDVTGEGHLVGRAAAHLWAWLSWNRLMS